jgi:outer membrane protein assembly factor BamB
MNKTFKQPLQRVETISRFNTIALSLMLSTFIPFIQAAKKIKPFQQVAQEVPNYGGVTLITNNDLLKNSGKLLVSGYNHHVRIFNPATGIFEDNAFVLAPCDYSFPNATAIIPPDPNRNIVGGFACSSFIDGRIWTVLNDGTVIQSNLGTFTNVPVTGPVNLFTFNPTLAVNPEFGVNGIQGAQPMYYRKSNNRLYTQSGFDNTQIFMINPSGSVPFSIPLSSPATINTGKFGTDDKLYAPDFSGNQIVQIDVDTGLVTTVTNNIPAPIALDIDNNGIFYIASRSTANVYKYNRVTNTLKTLTKPHALEPALSGGALSSDQTEFYVTNDQSSIYAVNTTTGAVRVLISSPIVGPWDLATDGDNSIYIADNGALKEFNTNNGSLIRKLTLASSAYPLYNSFGLANGVSVDETTIVITDITLGNILVVNKNDFSLHDIFTFFDPVVGQLLFGKQPFSAIRIVGGPVGEYYLFVNPVDGLIVKIFPSASGLQPQIFASGLRSPVKLKLSPDKQYVYVVEAGFVVNEVPNTGRVSRIKLDQSTPPQVLVDDLDQPEGFDINPKTNTMYIYETNKSQIVSANATTPTANPEVVVDQLAVEDEGLFYQLAPLMIHPLAGLAVTSKLLFFNQTQIYQTSQLKI